MGSPFCPICGKCLKHKRGNTRTCGMTYCQASLLLHPRRDPSKGDFVRYKSKHDAKTPIWAGVVPPVYQVSNLRISPKDAKRFFEAIDPRLLNENSNWSVYGYTPMRDRRGERNQAGKDSIWGFLSRKFIFLRSISRFAGKTSLVINRPPGVSVADYFRKHFMGGKERETDKLLDYLYVWKCGCAARHEVIYPTIESLPDTDGRHGACPNCGAAPLEVKTWKV